MEDSPLLGSSSLGSINNRDGNGDAVGREPGRGAGVFGSIVNLTNTILGAGLLAVPFALRMSGLLLGLFILVGMCTLSGLSFDSLARSAQITGLFTYKAIALKTYGKSLALVAEIVIFLYTFLNLVARPIIEARYISTVLEIWIEPSSHFHVLTQSWLLILIVSAIVFPLTMLRNIDPLKYSSFFSLLCVLFTSAVVVVEFARTPELHLKLEHIAYWPDSVSALISLGLLVVSFCAHYNAPRMYQELERRSIGRFRVVIAVSMATCLLLYSVVGVTGYLSCLDLTSDNVLDDYPGNNVLVTVARLALVVALIFSTPLVLFACRRSFLVIFVPSRVENCPFWLWILISGSILVLSGIIAYLIPSISVIFGFSGAIFGVSFVFLIPGVFFVLIAKRSRDTNLALLSDSDFQDPTMEPNVSSNRTLWVTGVLLIVLAIVMGVLGTTGSVFNLVNKPNTTAVCSNATFSQFQVVR